MVEPLGRRGCERCRNQATHHLGVRRRADGTKERVIVTAARADGQRYCLACATAIETILAAGGDDETIQTFFRQRAAAYFRQLDEA